MYIYIHIDRRAAPRPSASGLRRASAVAARPQRRLGRRPRGVLILGGTLLQILRITIIIIIIIVITITIVITIVIIIIISSSNMNTIITIIVLLVII